MGIAIAVAVVAVLAAGYGFSALSKVKRELLETKKRLEPQISTLLQEKSDLEAEVVRERERAEKAEARIPEVEAVSQELAEKTRSLESDLKKQLESRKSDQTSQ